ncbi:Gp15 family bacteriophage protein [Anaerorhabdus sp.]|uniref:Gp15 family bacteriophage protein n=1 Tax=Anaerorhabdus sp. TaxID=1872524 RepID=UPI002B2189AD|nr:Gp15 family bacteriophage protein [Anaerorhabdus sp.]MEA4875398.1 Gp15 family bacteriophage protein [Anaerorhabdus sp.]
MSFNFLLDEYPNEVIINEVAYTIESNFKEILKVLQLHNDNAFSEEEKILNSISLFYKTEIPHNFQEAYNEMLNFIKMYSTDEQNQTKSPSILDYEIDNRMIYSAFKQNYRIDLNKENIHWYEFNCLLENLSDNKPKLVQIMEIRAMEIDENYSSKHKAKLRKLKREYSLEKQEDICNSFANSFFLGVKGGQK